MTYLGALLAGTFFGAGLVVSQMYDPQKVLGFLNLAGNWDPSLAFVMGSALLIAAPAFYIAKKRTHSFSKEPIRLPSNTKLDKKLILGAGLFGIGWGLVGLCPGPAFVQLLSFDIKAYVFMASMLIGFQLTKLTKD